MYRHNLEMKNYFSERRHFLRAVHVLVRKDMTHNFFGIQRKK